MALSEIRTIRLDESDAFLQLLCATFGLELDRARSVFYNEPLFDLRRKWGAFEGGELVSILTTVPLHFGWGSGIGIAGVATGERRRGLGYAGALLDAACSEAAARGETAAYLFAKRQEVYARNGFVPVDSVIRGEIERSEEKSIPPMLEGGEIERLYDAWAAADPSRLRRDRQRWNYWKWGLRVCTRFEDGYLCAEGGTIREVVASRPSPAPWSLPPHAEWVGLESMTRLLGVPVPEPKFELHLMARGAPGPPGMFMTDQF